MSPWSLPIATTAVATTANPIVSSTAPVTTTPQVLSAPSASVIAKSVSEETEEGDQELGGGKKDKAVNIVVQTPGQCKVMRFKPGTKLTIESWFYQMENYFETSHVDMEYWVKKLGVEPLWKQLKNKAEIT